MSSVNELASSFVEMAKAYERLPTLETDLIEARNTISDQSAIIQRLELKLIDRAQEIASLHSTIRALEVSRDDAELRFLECDDAKSTLVRVLQGIIGDAQGVLAAIEPVPAVSAASETTSPSPVSDTPLAPEWPPQTDDPSLPNTPPTEGREPSIPSPAETHSSVDTSQTEASSSGAEPIATPTADVPSANPSDGASVATPPADASSDPEPVKYISTGEWGIEDLNPVWIDWHNRQLAAHLG